jgi:hypothetical protein
LGHDERVALARGIRHARTGGIPVPLDLVCRKILTAPDASSLSVYQDGQKWASANFPPASSRKWPMLDEDNPPPEGLVARAGYQIRLTGNVAFGDFTNRVKFDGRVGIFAAPRVARVEFEILRAFCHGRNPFAGHQPDGHLQITSDGATVCTCSPSRICKIQTRCCACFGENSVTAGFGISKSAGPAARRRAPNFHGRRAATA